MSTSSSTRPIIGVAGTFSSGQDSLCTYLANTYNFYFESTSDIVREEATKRYGSIERPVLQKTGSELRTEQGGGVLVLIALQKFYDQVDLYDGVAIAGIRSIGEFNAVKEAGGVMVFVDAPIELRYERMKARRRDAEMHVTLQEFKDREATEAGSGDSDADFNRDVIGERADYHIKNDGTLGIFHQRIDKLMTVLQTKI